MNKKMIPLFVLLMLSIFSVSAFAGDVDVDFDMDSGTITITNTGFDSSSWHPGQVAETNYFGTYGDVIGSYDSSDSGLFGGIHTTINAYTDVGGGGFVVNDYQDFNVLSANHIYNTEGYFVAGASGSYAEINMDIHPSMYVWSEHDQSGSVLVGSSIYKNAWVTQNSVLQGDVYMAVNTDGLAQMSNQFAWGFGIYESGAVTADYSSGLNYVSATGTGSLTQSVYGLDYAEFNGFVMPSGGSASLGLIFSSGISGTYTMSGD